MNTIKALVVDDTIVYRKIVGDVLNGMQGIEVVGTANNGKIALSKIRTLKPDLITLDIEMPEMNGIEVLQELKNIDNPPLVIMVSTRTQQGGEMTIKALELGAFDFLPKPEEGRMADNMLKVKQALDPIVRHVKRHRLGIAAPQQLTPAKKPVPPENKNTRHKNLCGNSTKTCRAEIKIRNCRNRHLHGRAQRIDHHDPYAA